MDSFCATSLATSYQQCINKKTPFQKKKDISALRNVNTLTQHHHVAHEELLNQNII